MKHLLFFFFLQALLCWSEQDFFGNTKDATGLYGYLYDLKNDPELNPTSVTQNGNVNTQEYYDKLESLLRKGLREKDLEKYRIADEVCNFEYMAIRNAKADVAPAAFGSAYIDPKGILIVYQGIVKKAPSKEFRFAGYFDDAVSVIVNGKVVFYSAWQDANRLKPEEESNGRKEGNPTSDAYGEYIRLKKGDDVKIAFAEVPGGHILGALKVQMKRFDYAENGKEDPILHPFVARKVDDDLIQEIKQSRVNLELRDIPEFIFEADED